MSDKKDETGGGLPDFLMPGGGAAKAAPPEVPSEAAPETPAPAAEAPAAEVAEEAPAKEAAPPEPAAAEPPSPEPAPAMDANIAGGLLMGSDSDIDPDDIVLEEGFAATSSESKLGSIGLGVAVLLLLGAITFVATNEKLSGDIGAFVTGDIAKEKEQRKLDEEAKFRAEQRRMKNRYGEVVLNYTPPTAQVVLTQLKWTETAEAFLARADGGADTRSEPSKKDIPNRTSELKEREIVNSLPLSDLPIIEKAEGDENTIHTYAYEVEIKKEHYHSRNFLFADKDHYNGSTKRGVEKMWFAEIGPDVYTVGWNGCDLEPKPEARRDDYVKARIKMTCFEKSRDGKLAKKRDELDRNLRDIQQEFSFRTRDEWLEVDTALRENTTMWPGIEEELAAAQCEQ